LDVTTPTHNRTVNIVAPGQQQPVAVLSWIAGAPDEFDVKGPGFFAETQGQRSYYLFKPDEGQSVQVSKDELIQLADRAWTTRRPITLTSAGALEVPPA
jgi:hypothetical protein